MNKAQVEACAQEYEQKYRPANVSPNYFWSVFKIDDFRCFFGLIFARDSGIRFDSGSLYVKIGVEEMPSIPIVSAE